MFSSDSLNKLFLLFFVAFFPLIAHGAASVVPTHPVEINLGREVDVAGDQVVLGDVATIYAKSLQDFRALSGLVISRIPDDKEEVRLPASYLEARVRAALPRGTVFALHAPQEVVFRSQKKGLNDQEISAEIARLARSFGKVPAEVELEVVLLSGAEQIKGISLAKIRIEAQAEMEHWKGDLGFKVSRIDSANSSPLWLRARLRWFQKAWFAVRQLGANEPLQATQFTEGRIETTNLREEPLQLSSEALPSLLKNSRLKRTLLARAPLLPSFLERRPDAMAGAPLRVVFRSESGVEVSAEGQLVAPGSIGSDVKARLRSSKKVVTGKLVSQGQVEVSL